MRWPRDRVVLLTLPLSLLLNCSEFGGLEAPDEAPLPRGGSKSWAAGGARASAGNGQAAAGAPPRTAGGANGRSPAGSPGAGGSGSAGAGDGEGANGSGARRPAGGAGAGEASGASGARGSGTTLGGSSGLDHAGAGRSADGGSAGRAGAGGADAGGAAGEAGAAGAPPTGAALRPFISELIEGTSLSGNIKALEISVRAAGSLSGCQLNVYANGSREHSRVLALSEVVTPSEPLVICSPSLDSTACQRRETLPFNGNDAILLLCAGAVADAFGTLGHDPSETGWRGSDFTTTDTTLRRRCVVTTSDLDPEDDFAASTEWWTPGPDIIDGLGTHCSGVSDSDPTSGTAGAGGASGASGASATDTAGTPNATAP